jgi:peptide-methionine (S)-S-oxide reductase
VISNKKSPFPFSKSVKQGGSHLNMFFGNIFGGGAFEAKIDYSTLDHPGRELAEAAEAGKVLVTSEKDPNLAIASFAGGCFWGLELAFQRVPGVAYTAVGYTQGREEKPTYEQVCAGATGHTEAVIVYFDPKEVEYGQLLETFFGRVDPTVKDGQGSDRGRQYRTGVYFHTPEQEEIARARFESEKVKYRRPIATEFKAAMPFWPAEKYHQQYLEK